MASRFGSYSLLKRLAIGGMAEIWLARKLGEAGFEKRAVIKRILPHYSEDEDFMRMFLDEARIAALLDHPNIVQVNDFGLVDGQHYIAMEYIEGFDLRRICRQCAKVGEEVGPNRAAQIGLAIARGLGYAHTKQDRGHHLGIVHRDISPHNVLVSMDGDVKVMDFGIAKASDRISNTRTGVVKGKVAYMSPEQAGGEPLGMQSDIFAAGICLWELVSGTRLYTGDSDYQIIKKIHTMDVPRLDSLRPELPPRFADVVARMLKADRSERYATMRDVEHDLAEVLHALGGAHKQPLDAFMREVIPQEWIVSEDDAGISDGEAASFATQANTVSGGIHAATRKTRTIDGEPAGTKTKAAEDTLTREKPAPTMATIKLPATSPQSAEAVTLRARLSRWHLNRSRVALLVGVLGVAAAVTVNFFATRAAVPDTRSVATPAPATLALTGADREPSRVLAEPTAVELMPRATPPPVTPPERTTTTAAPPLTQKPAASAPRAASPLQYEKKASVAITRLNALGCTLPAQVFIDGRRAGVVTRQKKWITIPLGIHKVHVVSADGSHSRTQTLEVEEAGLEVDYDCRGS